MLSQEKINELLQATLDGCHSCNDEYERIRDYKGEYQEQLRDAYCDALLYSISQGYTKYDIDNFAKNEAIQIFCKVVSLLPKDYAYYYLLSYFYKREDKKALSALENYLRDSYKRSQREIEQRGYYFDEASFIDYFFEPFKQGFPGFWAALAQNLKTYPSKPGIPELCEVIDEYYSCSTDEDALELLIRTMQKFPDCVLVKELIGYTYYSLKMWNNAIAYLEATEDNGLFFSSCDANFMMGWCYGKLKNHRLEESYYRKSLETAPDNSIILNNLGYSLYLQKKYVEAKTIFEQCLELDASSVFAANNYVRALIALGRNKDAKDFVKNSKLKISKTIVSRVDKLDNSNARISKAQKEEADDSQLLDDDFSQENAVDLGIKRQQFSNEKLLEDELTARIEQGIEVFGKKLKMYKRKGVYGRQFIIPIGRLDLLCEDDKGDLYIIELKKDSGYDDAYKQTASYLDWFEQNEISKGKKVYGIICLNSPTKELIEKVHADKRMKLFEYQISYTER